ncbi:MAG: [protein-PII] uridylyltransferase [Ilumatobacteraceae bacterium]|nr:[protein-PII] uridylyltransferase [Ilumatobacteraceae bacterium]
MTSRAEVIVGPLRGGALCEALSDATDDFLRGLYADAVKQLKNADDVALIAVGGYGRRELAPFSDLDVLLVHRGVKKIDEIASLMWYPIWDAGLKLGHAVRTPKETLQICATDLDTATALVTARHLAGSELLAQEVIGSVRDAWRQRGRTWLVNLHERMQERYVASGEVAFLLEPNIKESLGGLRDIHALWWAIEAGLVLTSQDADALKKCNETLLQVRVALHQHTNRVGDVLHLEEQISVAAALGYANDDALMSAIAVAGQQVAWIADEAWSQLDPPASASPVPQGVASGVALVNGEIRLADDIDPADDPTLVLRVATAAARHRVRIDRDSLNRLGERTQVWPDPWPAGASDDLVSLLLEGDAAIAVFKALDQRNLIVKVLPEWEPNRSRPQRNAYHRYTVDRHLWQTVANAAALADRVSRPDLLVLGALFHDIGKGYPGDHTEVGVKMFATIGVRMGLSVQDIDIVTMLIQHHLLLPDIATRRDLSDDATLTMVAETVKTTLVLELLHALTEADSLATGSSAWGSWKAGLVAMLVDRVSHVLGGGDVKEVMWRLFPDAAVLELMSAQKIAVRTTPDQITVVSPDRPGTFSRVAGVMALHGLDVLGAEAHSDEQGMAASEFRVVPPTYGPIEWQPIAADVTRVLNGELALDARLAERAATYRAPRATTASAPAPLRVRIDNTASSNATVIEIHAPDQLGILHRMTKALADCGLDIRHARVQTLGNEVVDTFYVRTAKGTKVTDIQHQSEIERAILHAAV